MVCVDDNLINPINGAFNLKDLKLGIIGMSEATAILTHGQPYLTGTIRVLWMTVVFP